ncbi:MAG: hypothetical protein IKC95_06985 [Oscillospiraceae bacterium]|nr:hypothetical protein [Oscillospiraceae bacterium]
MDTFIKASGGVLIALVLYLVLVKQGKDISLLLTLTVCCMVTAVAIGYLKPVVSFINSLQIIGNLDDTMLIIILKAVGIGLLSEIIGLVCADAGNAALGQTLKILAGAVILWLSLPLFHNLIELVEEILVSI